MSAMTSFTLRTLAKNRVRTGVTIAGVMLAAALLTAVLTSVNSLNAYLYNMEVADNGIWTASAWTKGDDEIERARQNPATSDMVVMRDVGFAALSYKDSQRLGHYLPFVDVEGDIERICAVYAQEGRLPERAFEVMLPSSWRDTTVMTDEPCAVGSVIEVELGQRAAVASERAFESTTTLAETTDGEGSVAGRQAKQEGDRLSSGDGYRQASVDGGAFDEQLVDVKTRTFTVVGFYSTRNIAASTGVGYAALTCGSAEEHSFAKAYVATSDLKTEDDIDDAMTSSFEESNIAHHDALLRYSGISSDRAVWDTFYQITAVLAVVITVACVSLIYNAFAISVAERTRQFGLLSSIGASRRQIRRAIVFEACVIAAIGIPLGLIAGIGGTAVVLGALGPSLESVLEGSAGAFDAGGDVAFSVSVDAAELAMAAALALVTVLVSVWVPAHRAGSVNAIDAIRRTSDVRPTRTARADACSPWTPRGFGLHRLFGVSGQLAWASRKRGRAKGRAASVSLALAIVLLMTAGSFSTTMGHITNVLGASSEQCDISIAAFASQDDESITEQLDVCAALYHTFEQVEGTSGLGWTATSSLPFIVPADMAGKDLGRSGQYSTNMSKLDDDSFAGYANVCFIDDESFRAWAKSINVDAEGFFGPTPRAIALKSIYGNNGKTYTYDEMFNSTGTLSYIAAATFRGQPVDTFTYVSPYDSIQDTAEDNASAEEGASPDVTFKAIGHGDEAGDLGFSEPLSNVDMTTVSIEVAAISDEVPPQIKSKPSMPTIVMPQSAAEALVGTSADASGATLPYVSMMAYFDADEHISAASDLTSAGEEFFGIPAGSESHAYFYVSDNVASQENYRMLITIIDVFTLLFTGILMLIAMANVFNTLTNGLILRRREFAVMRSVGLGNRAFRKMIACECLGYGIRGLIPGIIAAAGVSYLLFRSLTSTVSGIEFSLPWGHIALAIAFTALVMVASVAYGMHRCRTDNVVEALRMDVA